MKSKLENSELDKISGGAGEEKLNLDDGTDMMEMMENEASDEEHHFSKFKKGTLKAGNLVYKFGSGVKDKFKFYYGKIRDKKHKK